MGFFELLLIAIVSLVVIGPERLPETVRAVSLWIGRLKRSLRETRSEIEKQIGADDIRRQLHNEEIMRNLEATKRDIEASKREIEQAMEPERAQRMQQGYGAPVEAPDHAHIESDNHSQTNTTSDATPPASGSDKS